MPSANPQAAPTQTVQLEQPSQPRKTATLLIAAVAIAMTFGFGIWIKNQIPELGDSDQKPQTENPPTAAPAKPGITYESLTQGLVVYYPFNGTAKDESGNGNDGIATNVEFVQDGFGTDGKSGVFSEGSNITLSADNLPQGNSPRTVSCFVKVTGAKSGTETHILGWGNRGQLNQTFGLYGDSFDSSPKADGFLAWSQWGDGVRFTEGMRGAKQDVWYHITATFDGKKLVTFLNGKSADQGNFTLSTGAGQLIIGQSDYRRILEGQVDELRIYDRALSAEEVSALYNLEKP